MGGGFVLAALQRHRFRGRLIPVNPRYGEISGLQCASSVAAIGEPVDLAVFALPAKAMIETFRDLPDGMVSNALVLSSGFSEVGDDGACLERELVEIARAKHVRLVGPNSVGIVNLANGLVATISQAFDRTDFRQADIALVSQSGAFGTALVARAQQEGLGIRYFISSGNEADVGFAEISRALIERADVRMVCGYLENVRDGDGFKELAATAWSLRKPLVVLKAGTSATGSAAAKSHTGALVGSDAVAQSVFDAYNVVRAQDGEQLLDLLKVFDRAPRATGKRLVLVSHSGGAGVLAADAAEAQGAVMPAPPAETKPQLQPLLPGYATIANPLDMTGAASLQSQLMVNCLRIMLESETYDAGLLSVALIWREGEALLQALDALAGATQKPFAVSWTAPANDVAPKLQSARFPVFPDPSRAASALARKLRYDSAGDLQTDVRRERRATLTRRDFEGTAGQIAALGTYDISLPRQQLVQSLEAAESFRKSLGKPVVLKVAAPALLHRTEAGGVAVDLRSSQQLEAAYDRILAGVKATNPDITIDGVVIQEMIRDGAQVFVGMKRDEIFGPIVAIAPGGSLVELIAKPVMRPAPIDERAALDLLTSPVLDALLNGFRGGPKLDRRALAKLICNVSDLALDCAFLAELEINPAFVLPYGSGCVAVDYKFRLC